MEFLGITALGNDFSDMSIGFDYISNIEYVHVLDSIDGIVTFKRHGNELVVVKELKISVPKGIAIDSELSTMLMVVETKSKQQILVEFYFDYANKNYYVNKFTYLAEKAFDIILNKNYGFVIGYNTHKIVMHGIYSKFKEDFG